MMCFGLKDRKRLKTNHCVIVLLDDTQLVHELHASSTGQDLLDVVIKHLNLLETSYFGLRYFATNDDADSQPIYDAGDYTDNYNASARYRWQQQRRRQVWLDVERNAIKQLRDIQPMTVYFGVKYYAPDPCKLAEEITRYQFFLQCKQDILAGRLPVHGELAIELFALAVQSELGDYEPQRHPAGYVSEFQFLPTKQSPELEGRVALLHANLTGQVPATAELNFLERVKRLDMYGADLHPIQYDDGGAGDSSNSAAVDEYALGLTPSGVSVLRNNLKVAHYVWPRIVKTKCQGRCFLMDVTASAPAAADNNGRRGVPAGSSPRTALEKQRFGFRLVDKRASRNLRLALEQHKSFYHLISNSLLLNQLTAQQNQQQLKLSQRFRHSIRAAVHLGLPSQPHLQNQQQGQRQQQLRSSIKSLGGQSQYLDRRPPAVVRMPSRRYGNYQPAAMQPTSSGPPLPAMQHAHTMLDHQRQQALMLMSQLASRQQAGILHGSAAPAAAAVAVKSQTLRPISSKQAAANREKNQYYHQMMMAMMAGQQQQQQSAAARHMLQPQAATMGQLKEASAIQQLFSARPQQQVRSGHESPRSTKSAIAPSGALKLASKKLAKQQLLYGATSSGAAAAGDLQPLIAYDPLRRQQHNQQVYSNYYGVSTAYNVNCASASASPRSARSARLAGRHKSKSTNENLHLLHTAANLMQVQPKNNNKMLLATTDELMRQQQLLALAPPPNYNGNVRSANRSKYSDNESELSRLSKAQHQYNRKRATFALTNEQANILFAQANELNNSKSSAKRRNAAPEADDDYCCSRSDCSSVSENKQQPTTQTRGKQTKSQAPIANGDWNSIRRRHENFSRGKAFQFHENNNNNHEDDDDDEDVADERKDRGLDANNNSAAQLVKNISNKQATPILLSMNFEQGVNNNKAIQLLNLQRQQLNSSSSTASGQSSSSSESVKASLQSTSEQPLRKSGGLNAKTKADSTASNSTTTSGYYAGSNSTGSASADSDSQQSSSTARRQQVTVGSRAKIALGSHQMQARMSGDRLLIGNEAHLKHTTSSDQPRQLIRGQQQMQQFYLGDSASKSNQSESKPIMDDGAQENWHQQGQPSSLKYVSFDV